MTRILIDKSNIPLWSGTDGAVVLNANVANPNDALTVGDSPVADASFNVAGNQDIALGSASSVSIGVKAGATFKLAPAWKDHTAALGDLVTEYQLGGSLSESNVLLAMQLGADASISAAGSFKYSVLSAGATLVAGADAGFVYVRSFPRETHFGPMLNDFFKSMRLPADVSIPPAAGEVIAFEYGGFLKFGVNAAAGYEIKGTKSFDVAELKLSEHYDLSVTGKLNLNASLAGRFSVEVRRGSRDGWAQVVVRRKRTKELQFAADLTIGATLDTQGLPESGKEFLGALIGVRAKNWLNLIDSAADQAGKIQSIGDLKARLDGLAGDFISKYAGKAIDQLLPPETAALLGRLQKVVDSYNTLESSAIALFDRYFDPVLDKTKELAARLQHLKALASWDQLKGEVDPMLWNIVRQLTDGDPLGWILGKIPGTNIPSLDELQKRAGSALDMIQNAAHEEIRTIITLAKSQFGLDHFFTVLDSIDTPDKLKTALTDDAKHFVNRLINQEIDKLNGKDLKKAFEIVQKVVHARDAFWKQFDNALKQAAQQTFGLNINAAYNRSDERTALIDLEIRLMDDAGNPVPAGQRFMQLAARGDFQEVLANYQPDVVRLNEGELTHKATRESKLLFNIAGWHQDFSYMESYRVIVNADQQIRPTDSGLINVFTTIDMTDEKQRRRKSTKAEEDMHGSFMLRFIGETRGVVGGSSFNKADQSYAIDVITGRSASYNVTFTDSSTTPAELDDAMRFAKALGLDTVGATVEALKPILQVKNGRFGPITAEYAARFTEIGLSRLFASPISATDIRNILRVIVVGNYFGQGNIADVGWLYASDDVKKLYEDNGPNFVNADSILGEALQAGEVKVVSPIPGVLPGTISNVRENRILVAGLFDVERDMTGAFMSLQQVVTSPGPIALADFRKALGKFGSVLNAFDSQSLGDNSTFAVFDGLIQLHVTASQARSSSMAITASPDGQERHMTFMLQAEAALAA